MLRQESAAGQYLQVLERSYGHKKRRWEMHRRALLRMLYHLGQMDRNAVRVMLGLPLDDNQAGPSGSLRARVNRYRKNTNGKERNKMSKNKSDKTICESGCCDGWASLESEVNGTCPACDMPTVDGDAAHGCNHSPVTCDACGHCRCDDSC